MEWQDLKIKSSDELRELLAETRRKSQNLSFQAHSKQLKEVHKIKVLKKQLAQIQMLLDNKKYGK